MKKCHYDFIHKANLLRFQVNLLNVMKFVTSSLNQPAGIAIPYRYILLPQFIRLSDFMKAFRMRAIQLM